MAHGRGGAGRGFGREGAGSGANLSNILPPVMRPIAPDLFLDFTKDLARTTVLTTAASLITTSRASAGYANDASGNWINFGSNVPRITSLGLLVEESRTNSIRNNSMQGAIVQADSVELLTNGNFASGSAGWTTATTGGGVITFATGSVTMSGDGATFGNYIARQISGLTVGRNYVFSVAGTVTDNGWAAAVGSSAGSQSLVSWTAVNAPNAGNSSLPDRIAFTATSTSHWVSLSRVTFGVNATATSLSVQDGERCENGGFTANPINAAESTYQNGWQWYKGGGSGSVTWDGVSSITITGDGSHISGVAVAIPCLVGATYTITADITLNTCDAVIAGTTAINGSALNVASSVGAGQKFQFTATASTMYVGFQMGGAKSAKFANVSVKSAGVLPTNWSTYNPDNLIVGVTSVGPINGVDTFTCNVSGTIGSNHAIQFFLDGAINEAALYGQTWSMSAFMALSNSTNMSSVLLDIRENTSGGVDVTDHSIAVTTPGASLARASISATLTGATTANVQPLILFSLGSGSVNFNVTFGWPQLENNTLINATVASAVKAANGTGGVNGSAVYKLSAAGATQATLNCTWAAGVLTVNSVASAGSYTAFPTSPATLTYVSGAATGWTGATVNLTPTDNSALAAASSPIRTTGAAATRAADFVTLTSPPSNGAAYTVFGKGTSQIPAGSGYNNATAVIAWDDGVGNNATTIFRNIVSNSGIPQYFVVVGGTAVNGGEGIGVTPWAGGVSGKLAMAYSAGSQNGAFNGAGGGVNSTTIPGAGVLTRVVIGCNQNGDFWNGFLSQIALWRSTALSSGNLQSITT